jgi:small nuclear ribonucleoprotein (snRNP)-like protein
MLSTFVMTNYRYYIDTYIIVGLTLQEMKCITGVLTSFDPNSSIALNICHNGVFFLHIAC